jgi:LuxR family transcriptional regulator, activator of tox operons
MTAAETTGQLGADTVVATVAAIGRPEFPDRLRQAVRTLTGGVLCSVFALDDRGAPQYLFAAAPPARARFAAAASLRYAARFWRRDPMLGRLADRPGTDVRIARQSADAIPDDEYRHWCYEVGGVVERISLLGGERPLLVSGYRLQGEPAPATGPLAAYAPVLIAAVARHRGLVAAGTEAADRAAIEARLADMDLGLTERERQTVAGILLGRTQQEIADDLSVAVSTVITYRRRAYQRLGVADRRALAARLRHPLHAPASSAQLARSAASVSRNPASAGLIRCGG